MLRERAVANFSNKRDPSKATHVKALASDAGESIVKAVRVVVDLIWAYTACKQSVLWLTALLQ